MDVNCSCMLIVLIGTAASIMGIYGDYDKPTETENVFLIRKWRMWFKDCDTNHDGKLSMEDAEFTGIKFTDLEHLDEEKGEIVKETFEKWWDECVLHQRKGDSEQEFIESLNLEYKADKEKFRKEVKLCNKLVYSAINVNGDNFLSKQEFRNAYAAFGHQKIAMAKSYFNALNPVNDLVSLSEVVDSWDDFLTSTDESKHNMLIDGYDVYGFE